MQIKQLPCLALSAVLLAATSPAAMAAAVPATVVGASSNYQGYPAADAVDMGMFTDWASNGMGAASYIDFDLGSVVQLSSFTLVDRLTSGGDNNAYSGGTTDFTTAFTLSSYSDSAFTNLTGSESFAKTTPGANHSQSDFAFTSPTALAGQYLRYTVDAANGPNPGLDDITFDDAVSAAPEPGAWALMMLGVGAIGAMLGNRKRVIVDHQAKLAAIG